MKFAEIPTELLDQPAAPLRGKMDTAELEELITSIAVLGILQALIVKRKGNRYEVVAGHRRMLAAQHLHLATVPCRVLDEELVGGELAAQLHENIYRTDLTVIEEAVVYAELFEQLQDVDAVCAAVRRSRRVVESRLELLAGDAQIRDAVQDGKITGGVAEQLNKIPEESTRRYLLDAAIRQGATVESVRDWRKMYHGVDVLSEEARAAAAAGAASAGEVSNPNICWLCGSSEDQHDLRVRLVHASCERMIQRNAAAAAPAAGSDEHT